MSLSRCAFGIIISTVVSASWAKSALQTFPSKQPFAFFTHVLAVSTFCDGMVIRETLGLMKLTISTVCPLMGKVCPPLLLMEIPSLKTLLEDVLVRAHLVPLTFPD